MFTDLFTSPQNVLLAIDGHILLADFGVSKLVTGAAAQASAGATESSSEVDHGSAASTSPASPPRATMRQEDALRRSTMVGTPEYMGPEVLSGTGYGYAADWWSAGIMLHEILTGMTPFQLNDSLQEFFEMLKDPNLTIGQLPEWVDAASEDLIRSLLVPDESARLGTARCLPPHQSDSQSLSDVAAASATLPSDPPSDDLESRYHGQRDIQSHPFFAGIDWERLERMELAPPFPPSSSQVGEDGNSDGSRPRGRLVGTLDVPEEHRFLSFDVTAASNLETGL